MKDLTLLTVNWNQQPALELMLKSYVRHHYHNDEKLNTIIVDNGSTDNSINWLTGLNIKHSALVENFGHENAVNHVYDDIKTKYCLIVDTDIEFTTSIVPYLDYLKDGCVAVGDLINNVKFGETAIKPRLGAWFILFDYEKVREAGIDIFRDPTVTDWTYDVGSWFFEQIVKKNLIYHSLSKNEVSHIAYYEKFIHLGGVSWDMSNGRHGDRFTEIESKRNLVIQKLVEYSDVELRERLI